MSDPAHDTFAIFLEDWAEALVSNDAIVIGPFMSDDWVLVIPKAGMIERTHFL